VVECWQVGGTVDYITRFVCPDLAIYEALTTRLIEDPNLGVESRHRKIASARGAGQCRSLGYQPDDDQSSVAIQARVMSTAQPIRPIVAAAISLRLIFTFRSLTSSALRLMAAGLVSRCAE
jgi:hypothetical protein